MRSLHLGALCLLASSSVRADDAPSPPAPIELGIYTGAFISNYYHQYYDPARFPGAEGEPGYRPELRRVNGLAGVRFAYFFLPWLGAEADLNIVMAETKERSDHPRRESASIYQGRLQLMFQRPSSSGVVPYVSIGSGFGRLSSEYLGSDTDFPPFVGAGLRILVNDNLALRVDGRLMRAPTPHEPHTLNCNLGELTFGLSLRPGPERREPAAPASLPFADADGDGIADDQDQCPHEPEDRDQFEDLDGCPDLDNDRDGIADALDKCPHDAEDKDGFADDDGCPDPDNDGDGVADASDKCPFDAEDKDGFADDDGCPDPDNDGDGIADAMDKCPLESEVINGVDDEDGCPDKGNVLVVMSPDRLELLEPIEFRKNTAIVLNKSLNLLGQIGATLRAHPEIQKLRIAVHAQPTNKPEFDRRLSELRAQAIRDWLVRYGIDDKRLEARGFGGSKPLVAPTSRNAQAINERTELIILQRR